MSSGKWATEYQHTKAHYWVLSKRLREYVALCGTRVLDGLTTNENAPRCAQCERQKAWARTHRAPPSEDRWKERSKFFTGVADAMADQWGAV